jgi:hypothetical protein
MCCIDVINMSVVFGLKRIRSVHIQYYSKLERVKRIGWLRFMEDVHKLHRRLTRLDIDLFLFI